MKINIKNIKKGDIFSESSHYISDNSGIGNFIHIESNSKVTLSREYVEGLITSGDQFDEEREVGKEDKHDGTKGIRSIWQDIHSKDVFTVCFRKQDTPLSAKRLKELQEAQISKAIEEIESTAQAKKGVTNKAREVLARIQQNPILPYEPGEERILRGYKIDFESRDGKYRCIDIDLIDKITGSDEKAIRPVNINTIEWLIYKGVKYIVK